MPLTKVIERLERKADRMQYYDEPALTIEEMHGLVEELREINGTKPVRAPVQDTNPGDTHEIHAELNERKRERQGDPKW